MNPSVRLLKTAVTVSRALNVAGSVSVYAVAALTALTVFGTIKTLREL